MTANLKSKDTALLIHIEHSKPIEVGDFVKTLSGISGLFSGYVNVNGFSCEMSQAKLYVEKIEDGCIDIFLCETISASLLQFAENANTILDFAAFVKSIISYYTKGVGSKPELSSKDYRYAKDIFTITAGDNRGITSIGAINKSDKGHIFYNCVFNFTESNSAQNQLEADIRNVKDMGANDIESRQLMKIYQIRNDMGTDVGNKAIIDAISPKRLNLLFETDELKAEILGIEGNPMKKAFLVDVVKQTIEGKLVAYKIIALHDVIDLE